MKRAALVKAVRVLGGSKFGQSHLVNSAEQLQLELLLKTVDRHISQGGQWDLHPHSPGWSK